MLKSSNIKNICIICLNTFGNLSKLCFTGYYKKNLRIVQTIKYRSLKINSRVASIVFSGMFIANILRYDIILMFLSSFSLGKNDSKNLCLKKPGA